MLHDTFEEASKELEATLKKVLNNVLDEMANKMIKSLDKDGSENLEWTEFKHYMKEFAKESNMIMDVIRKAKQSK